MEKKMDLRIEKTYLSLHNAFTELMEEKRFEDFTVNELCQRAMIRRTTFYKHFADKYEYFAFYMKEVCASFQDQLPPDVLTEDINAYFLSMCQELLRFIDRHEKLVNHVMDSNMFPILLDSLSENIMYDVLGVLRQMHATKQLSGEQLEGIAAFYSGGLLSMLRLWLRKNAPIDGEAFLAAISRLLPKGLK
ncbi:MAG: TetR/AcrR family transcriptional regulator [Faecousia sp.]